MGNSQAVIGALLLAIVVLGSDAWVYTDAKRRADQGRSIRASIGTLALETPLTWFLGCLVLWIVFFPLYLTATGRNPFHHAT